MPDPTLICQLRQRRTAVGLSQGELARRVGVSRQALVAIEAGRQVPATTLALQLARALGCPVESLFTLPTGPRLTVRWARPSDAAAKRVAIGRIEGQWVAHAAPHDDRAADGLRILPPDAGPSASADDVVVIEPLRAPASIENNVLVAGCAPLLGLWADRFGRDNRDDSATWIRANSTEALAFLAQNLVHIAGIHFASADDLTLHTRVAQRVCQTQRAQLIHLARWRQGFVVAKGNPKRITGAPDLLRPDVRCAVRDGGAAAQKLLERVLDQAGHPAAALDPAGPRALDHFEVAQLVRWGVADVGVAIESVALDGDVGFVPLVEERFDLIVPESRLDTPAVVRFLDLVQQPSFRTEATRLVGYDLSGTGHASSVDPPDSP